MTNKDDILKEYVIDNFHNIMLEIKPDLERRNALLTVEPELFHYEINIQFRDLVKWKISRILSNNLNISLDDCLVFVESYNKEFELNEKNL